MAIKYKLSEDEKSILVNEEGNPIVINDDFEAGKQEFGLDAIHLYGKVPALQSEAKEHRLKAKEYSEKLLAYGDLDPKKAFAAIEIAKNLTAGDLTKKEEVERIQKETNNAWAEKFKNTELGYQAAVQDMQVKIDNMDNDLRRSLLSSEFASSPHFNGKAPTTTLTPDIAEAYFGKNFKIETNENGLRVPIGYVGGIKILSKKRPGEPADFNESMTVIIDNYSMKDSITPKSYGSGSPGGSNYSGQTINRGDAESFGKNLEAIASGKIKVV